MKKAELRKIPFYTVDAFTSVPYSGNPAAVCLLSNDMKLDDSEMQTIAAEVNLSETAFLGACNSANVDFKADSRFKLRWFTPTNEVPLCGHGTLATAAVLYFAIGNLSKLIEFETLSGILTTSRSQEEITLNFPLNFSTEHDKGDFRDLLKTIVSEDKVLTIEYSEETKKLLIRLNDEVSRDFLEGLKPDTQTMAQVQLCKEVRGVIVTVKGTTGVGDGQGGATQSYDFISRYFAPWNGIPEDPVTGSAHTVLAGYWSKVLNKTELFARQCSPRGGDVHMQLQDKRVDLTGRAVIMISGTLSC